MTAIWTAVGIITAVLFAMVLLLLLRRAKRATEAADLGSDGIDRHWHEVRGQLRPPPSSWDRKPTDPRD